MKPKNPHAQALGRMKSPAKSKASRENGRKGGRPKKEHCPICAQKQPTGTFNPNSTDKSTLPFRVQTQKYGRTVVHGDFATLQLARAAACGSSAVILLNVPAKQEGKK